MKRTKVSSHKRNRNRMSRSPQISARDFNTDLPENSLLVPAVVEDESGNNYEVTFILIEGGHVHSIEGLDGTILSFNVIRDQNPKHSLFSPIYRRRIYSLNMQGFPTI